VLETIVSRSFRHRGNGLEFCPVYSCTGQSETTDAFQRQADRCAMLIHRFFALHEEN